MPRRTVLMKWQDLEVKRKTQLRPPYWEFDTSARKLSPMGHGVEKTWQAAGMTEFLEAVEGIFIRVVHQSLLCKR